MEVSTVLLAAIAIAFAFHYFFAKWMMHFKNMGILYANPLPILGNMAPVIFRRISLAEHLQRFYNRFAHVKYFGFYNFLTPIIVIRDPELIRTIAVKNFDNFCDHRGFIDETTEPLMGRNLFALRGDYWREMRKVLSPAFTASKMKMMFKLMSRCAEDFSDFLANEAKDGKILDMKNIFGRYTNDVIATCAFGISIDSMRNPNNEFYLLAKEAMNFEGILSIKFFLGKDFALFSKLFGIKLFSDKVTNFFQNVVADTVRTRDKEGITRPDMIQLMMDTREKKETDISIKDMTAQAFVFFFAGFDSTSTFMSFLAYELALHQDIQSKLREEIAGVLMENKGEVTYEAINGMKYLDAVINETLRLYPLIGFLDRQCVKEFELPPATAGGKPITITPGTTVWFASYGIQLDSKYYPEPTKFDPERFLNGSVDPYTYMPFGIGPRMCIANRFALVESKIVIFHLLACCNLKPCVKTAIPMKFSKNTFVLMAEGGVWLTLEAREGNNSLLRQYRDDDKKNVLLKNDGNY